MTTSLQRGGTLSRGYAKLCDLDDFADPRLAAVLRDVMPDADPAKPHRKPWEFAMGASFLREVGALDGEAEILDVGAGSEAILFWLTRHARRVVGVDIYGRGAFGDREAVGTMLDDPASHAPYPYDEARLEVRDMDARHLDFPDESFDAVVSFSSIEHFGSPADIVRSAREIGRVLRPGGHAFIVTEVFVDHHPVDRAPLLAAVRAATLGRRCATATPWRRSIGDVFTPRELRRRIVGPSGLELMQPVDLTLSEASRANPFSIEPDGSVRSATGEPYPHVLMRTHLSTFTSVCLPLRKPLG
jgi:SAM-dependent methyltransferase